MSDSSRANQRGALIVVEGLDRAGKSCQCEVLLKSLLDFGRPADYIRFPDRTTPIGRLINSYLQGRSQLEDHSIHLLFSANRWEVAKRIEDNINNGISVIVDRYSYSGAVYSAAKGNHNLSLEWAWQPEIGLPRPDVCIFLRISPEEAAKRGGFGVERYENETMQNRVRELFLTLFDLQPKGDIRIVDAGRPVNEVSEDIQSAVSNCITHLDAIGPLRKLGPIPSNP